MFVEFSILLMMSRQTTPAIRPACAGTTRIIRVVNCAHRLCDCNLPHHKDPVTLEMKIAICESRHRFAIARGTRDVRAVLVLFLACWLQGCSTTPQCCPETTFHPRTIHIQPKCPSTPIFRDEVQRTRPAAWRMTARRSATMFGA
jgi:hypothetical protein